MRRQELHCKDTLALTDGDWFRKADDDKYWWQPRNCLPRMYWNASASKIIRELKPVFLNAACNYASAIQRLFKHDAYYAGGQELYLDNFTVRDETDIQHFTQYLLSHPSKSVVFGLRYEDMPINMHETLILNLISALSTSAASGNFLVLLDCSYDRKAKMYNSFLSWLQANNVQTINLCKLSRSDNCQQLEQGCTPQFEVAAQLILNTIDRSHYEALQEPRSCAVVSTAGYQSIFTNGALIDSMGYVIRVGVGPVAGFEGYVGSRTDLRIIRHSTYDGKRGDVHTDPNDDLFIIHDKFRSDRWPSWLYRDKKELMTREKPHWEVRRPNDASNTRLAHCLPHKRDLSTGMWAILLLSELTLCRELFLFGFMGHLYPYTPYHYFSRGVENENASVNEHYKSRAQRTNGHDFISEHFCLLKSASRVEQEHDLLVLQI